MKFLHLGDLHLGKRVNGFDFLKDQRFILDQVLALCEEHAVQAVVLAGDIYDVPVPPAAAVTLLDWFLTELTGRGIRVLAVSGNHDSADRLDYAAALLARQGVHIAGRFTGKVRIAELSGDIPVEFCLLPFVRPATVRHYLPEAPITDQDTAVAAALATLPPRREGVARVLVAHQTVLGGGVLPQCAGSESIAPDLSSAASNAGASVNIGTLDAVNAARFGENGGFDYVALGHIHRPQAAGAPHIRYAGAPLCYSLDEAGARKSAVLVTLTPAGAETELLPLCPRRAMRHITGPLAELTDPARVTDADDYIWATLTDDTPQPDAMAVLRAAYPNAMRLDYAPRGTGPDFGVEAAAAVRQKSFEELFSAFFEQMHGRPLTQEETAALNEMREEAQP